MIVEYTRYRIPQDRRELFVDAYEQAANYLSASPHCLAYELSHCVEDQDRYVLRIEWTSTEEHLAGFRRGRDLKNSSNWFVRSSTTSRK